MAQNTGCVSSGVQLNVMLTLLQGVRNPVRVNQIPRQIPPGPKYLKPWVGEFASGSWAISSSNVRRWYRLPLSSVASFHLVRGRSRHIRTTQLTDYEGAAFVELYFVLSSLFASRAYYAFGFLALTASIVLLTTATVSILFTYFILCAEEYRWVDTHKLSNLLIRI